MHIRCLRRIHPICSKLFRMLSPVLSLKPQNTTTSILFSKNTTGSKYLNESNTNQYHSPITNFNLSDLLHVFPSAVHDPTFSFNAYFFNHNTAPPFCHLVTKICQ